MDFTELGFQRLSPQEKPLFDTYYGKMKGYLVSTLCFMDMIAWNHSTRIYYKVMEDYLICIAWDSSSERVVFFPFLGKYSYKGISRIFHKVQELFHKYQFPFYMINVCEWMKPYYTEIEDVTFHVINERGLADYLYHVQDFQLAMNRRDADYNYRYFVRKYQPVTRLITPEHLEECLAFLDEIWCEKHQCQECCYGCIKETAKAVIPYLKELDARGIVVYVEEKMVAYGIVTCYNRLGFFEFKETRRGFRGVNEYVHRQCFERFLQDVQMINYSEDMGLEGLRKYKSHLAPYTLFPKYELQKK